MRRYRKRKHEPTYFSRKLRQLLKSRGMTQTALAQYLCVSRALITKWVTGDYYPCIQDCFRLADYFGVTLDELLRGEEHGIQDKSIQQCQGQDVYS